MGDQVAEPADEGRFSKRVDNLRWLAANDEG